ncbi:Transmembrane domain-containing protein [Spironucleus salmonicida]|uniref:Transmembrane domain-containing protein n=1 Tax=Spironucleus salmonicida TaxID=348837 RepID=V6LP25_9EUKA|nr:Transmembrane domain-containing protein [Spironucleus salmonicida]|eukprot:EST45993.1 Transmembrane domain-containing protein [Spironucleus salmonicida]
MSQAHQSAVVLAIPQKHIVGFVPFITILVLAVIEVFITFAAVIANKNFTMILPPSGIYFHMTWGVIFSLTVAFVENSLKWLLNRKYINLFGTISQSICAIFLICCIYNWLWINNATGIVFISKNFLSAANIRVSPEQLKRYMYTDSGKKILEVIITWAFPIQLVIVLVDTILSAFRKGKKRQVGILLKTDDYGNTYCQLDTTYL